MRYPTQTQALSAIATLVLLAGCSSGQALAPSTPATQGHHATQLLSGRVPSVLNPAGMLRLQNLGAPKPSHKASFDNCPAAGTIIYLSDFNTNVINIYKGGNLTPLVLCGQITNVANPQGMIVKAGNLYVAQTGHGNILGYHRGSTTPFITYTDPTCGGQFPVDVTVSSDNFVFATNIFGGTCAGSMSIFKKAGAYVGTIQNVARANSYFLTIQNDGTLYYDDNSFAMYKGSCVGGVCGSFSNTGAVFASPGGIRSEDGEDVALADQSASGGGAVYTFEPPNFTSGFGTCAVGGAEPITFDVNHSQHHMFLADSVLNQLTELKYTPSTGACAPKGSAPGNSSGLPIGVAVDRAEALR